MKKHERVKSTVAVNQQIGTTKIPNSWDRRGLRSVIPAQRACKLVTVAHLPGKASDEHLLLANANFTFPDAAKLRQPPPITRTTELEFRNRNSILKIDFNQLSRELSKTF